MTVKDDELPHVGVLEPLVIYGLLIAPETERKRVFKMLAAKDFIDGYLGGVYARMKAGKFNEYKLRPKERKRFTEEVVKPGEWALGQRWWNTSYYAALVRESAIDRGRVLAAMKGLMRAWDQVRDRESTVKLVRDWESMRP